jgi:hypothetical protein
LQITENAANEPAVGCTTIISPRFEFTLMPPPTGTLAVFTNSSPEAEFVGVGVGAAVAAAARVAIRKPLVTLIGTVRIAFVLGPLMRLPVLALNTLLSFGQVTLADRTCEATKFVAS